MKKLLTIICFSFSSLYCFSQKNIEDTRTAIYKATEDTTKVQLMGALGFAFSTINIDSAIFYANTGLQLARSINYAEGERGCLAALANALSEIDIPKSMQAYFQLLQISEDLNDKVLFAHCYQSIGQLHLYLGNSALYVVNLKKARVIFEQLNDKFNVASLNADIGAAILGEKGENEDSARYYLSLAVKDPAIRKSPFFSYYMGRLESASNPSLARLYFNESIHRFKESNDLRGLGLANRWFSIFYEMHGQLDSSVIVAKDGLIASQQLNFLRGIINNSTQLTDLYKKLGQTDSAYKNLSIMVAAKDQLLGSDKINKIQIAIIEEQQRGQDLLAEKASLQNRIKLYTSLAIAFVLLLLVLLFYRNQQRTIKSNQLLQKQRDEINSKRLELQTSIDALKLTQTQLIQAEKMASLGELTAGIAHEIQNPLNFVNNFSEVSNELMDEMKEELEKGDINEAKIIASDIKQNLTKINHHGKRADAIVKGMLQHSRSSTGQKEFTDINALADEYLRLSYHGLRAKDKSFNAELVTDFALDLEKVAVVPQDIGRVLLNLFNNAFYAVQQKRQLAFAGEEAPPTQPQVSVSTKKLGNQIKIRIKDNGIGIPEESKNKIFQPFFTTKPTGEGTGLGLSLSYDIITKGHGGSLVVESEENEFTQFTILLPAAPIKETVVL